MNAELTDFQKDCLKRAEEVISLMHRKLEDIRVLGITETYIHAKIAATPIEIWIYEDGAEISGPEIDDRLERQDFESLAELISEFGVQLSGLLGPHQG